MNLFVAAAFAWRGAERALVLDVLNDADAAGFQFLETELLWRGRSLVTAEIEMARRDFAHSFGSCSFREPLADLRALEWLD